MPLDQLIAFLVFAFVTSITPGPNNMMLLASGVNFGVRRTIPHMLGISVGFMLLVIAIGLGLGQVFERHPLLHTVLRYLGSAYLLYLAWNIARAGRPKDPNSTPARPFTAVQAGLFQWVNPKSWIMAISAITTYTPREDFILNVLWIAPLFAFVNLPSVGVWVLLGGIMRRWLENERVLRVFNLGMALLLVLSLYPILLS